MGAERTVRYYEDIAVGEALPPLRKEIALARMVAYSGATWDFVRLHYDAEYARGRGFPGPIVDGQMLGGYLAQLVQDWAGPRSFLRRLSFRNRVVILPGDVITCHGRVTEKTTQGGTLTVTCELWVENQRGERVVEPASAVVSMPSRSP